jgi:hypothetical protein
MVRDRQRAAQRLFIQHLGFVQYIPSGKPLEFLGEFRRISAT